MPEIPKRAASTAVPGGKLVTSKTPRMFTPYGSVDFGLMISKYWGARTHHRACPVP